MTARILGFILLIGCVATSAFATKPSALYIAQTYTYSVDLRKLENDQVKVELEFSGLAVLEKNNPEEKTTFCLPKIVPGIYGAMDFGQNLTSIEAFDYNDKKLEITRKDVNRWEISGNPSRLVYFINDGWEEFNTHKEGMFLSAESSFQENKAFVINHNTLFGYFEGFEHRSIELHIKKPSGFYGATSLQKFEESDSVDYYIARNYRQLVDNPIMYSLPDVTTFKIGKAEITVAMYSATGKKLSAEIAKHIQPLLEKQKAYLGGKLPVDHYTFILYHNENPDQNSSIGDGLEHSNSTLILMYMPFDAEMIKWNVYGIASHEFFHTVVPLGLHSEEIEHYNFNEPKLSRHIWLYEGTTEYFTLHMPVKEKAEPVEDFLRKLENKLVQMGQFSDDRSLTYLSINAIENQADYYNFYLKGALVNLCLDIKLRELSKGKYGVQDLVADLMDEYGENKPFKDDVLFDEMARISKHPEIRQFLATYVEGTEKLPLKAYFLKVGIDLNVEKQTLSLVENPSKSQLALRKAWIGQ